MDVQKKLDEIVDTVGSARSMPMSASCVINRAELLAMLEEVRAALPDSLAQAQDVIGGRDRVVQEARQEAERIIESAHAHRGSLVSDTEVARKSQEEADRILEEARREAEEIRAEADDYVDSKLANFEVVLTKTIGSVDRGREKLLGRAAGGEQDGMAGQPEDGPERSADPQTLRLRADEYVDTKLGAVSAVLTKTLEAVGRGRQKLLGARAIDELGAHVAAQEAAAPLGHGTSDDDYLADLAQSQAQIPAARPEAAPDASYYAATAGYQQQDAYGYQQQGYVQQQDPYAAAQGGYQQQDAYGWQQQPQGYDPSGYAPEQPQQQPEHQPHHQHQQPAAALDETSLFDTSMIDLDQLRQYEQGR
ncbi:cell division initiation protein [Streptomyces sp. ME19-01-6]|uniref:cell division initiation protein n=1 Tax=Streptomyces sp. ME19-01-6 TaxID=3028686 RepID=UPI0029B05747|nr:cell division initiation protein [Streptomyces sp. ME19-01-6]MDX3229461.1 cell division initiation protein [Streptomyces sp. ME19-01-6]